MSLSHNRWRTLRTSLVVIALLGAACDNGDDGAAVGGGSDTDRTTTAPETTTTLPETTTTAAPTPEEEVLAAYQGYWDAVDEALGAPQAQPELAALRQFGTGESLAGVVQSAETLLERGEAYRIPENSQYEHRAEVLVIDGETATVRDCSIDDAVRFDTNTGDVLDDAVSTRLYIAMLVIEQDDWKVATLDRSNAWEGVAGCAVEAR